SRRRHTRSKRDWSSDVCSSDPHDPRLAALAFALGSYRFGRYRKAESPEVRLVPPDGVAAAELDRLADAASLARDLVNTPSNDMRSEERRVGEEHRTGVAPAQ